jgi:hypothetical protein
MCIPGTFQDGTQQVAASAGDIGDGCELREIIRRQYAAISRCDFEVSAESKMRLSSRCLDR